MNGLKKLNDLLFPGAKTYERWRGKAVALGFQHAFAMSCATILVPLLTGLDVGVALLAAALARWCSTCAQAVRIPCSWVPPSPSSRRCAWCSIRQARLIPLA